LSFVAQRSQDRVGLCLFGDEPGLHLPAKKGAGAVARVVREVIAAAPTHGGTNFRAVLDLQERTLRRRSLLFLISDFVGFDKEHADILARVVDPFERELPAAGWLWFQDVEGGGRQDFDTRSKSVREAWRVAAEERDRRLREHLLRAAVDLVEIGTGQNLSASLSEPLIKYFAMRRRRKAGA
jgi:uncharacterized protein (DUF58 family)